MLEYLQISNLALMDSARIDLSDGFTAVTGETGAGKSVFLGALGLLAGNRKGREIIRQGAELCRVEAAFKFADAFAINLFLEECGLPPCEDGVLILSRSVEKTRAGKCIVNGSLTTLSNLAKLGGLWIDFHGPGEPQKLFDVSAQLKMLDAFARINPLKDEYLELLRVRQEKVSTLERLRQSKGIGADEADFIKAQIQKIDSSVDSEEELGALESDFKLSRAAAALAENASAISELMSGSDAGASETLGRALRLASQMSSEGGAEFAALEARLKSLAIELADISSEYENLAQKGASFTEERIAEIESKMAAWLEVSRKYGRSVPEVKRARENMQRRLDEQGDIQKTISKLSAEIEKAELSMTPLAEKIFLERKSACVKLELAVLKMLAALGFKKPSFSIALQARFDKFSADCGSSCEFMFSANAGQNPMPLAKIASSGELARVMLSIKAVLAALDGTPILVFDEVDANVGGEIGAAVGAQLKGLSEGRQVLCVTHLPQVAACAKNHFVVEKTQDENSTEVSIRQLDPHGAERIGELARMLGDRNSPSARKHAQKLLGL